MAGWSGIMLRWLIAAAALAFAPALLPGQPAWAEQAPEVATRPAAKPLVRASRHMVVAAHPQASGAGDEILARGGNAIDAMVAVQLVLGLVEPQSSGLGGGAFLLYHDAASGALHSLDGRETAPQAADPRQFLDASGKPKRFLEAAIGGRSVGAPGTVALLAAAHAKFGRLPWADLFAPAIRLAEDGFAVSPRLNASIADSAENLFRFTATRAYFLSEEAVPLFAGTLVKNPQYAQTLRLIADGGRDAFYRGPLAADIEAAVRFAPENPGALTQADLGAYEAKWRDPVCFAYRAWRICGMGPPSSGAIAIGQVLGMLKDRDLSGTGPLGAQSWRLIGDASRLAFADRARYLADPDYATPPKGLLDDGYLARRASLLAGERALGAENVTAGDPPSDHTLRMGDDRSAEIPATSHFSIVDASGNVVSMTTSIENAFGSRLMVRGFLLNNQLTDFSFQPEDNGAPVANRLEGGKRPRSSMVPVIAYRDGKPALALGSTGGSRIIAHVAQALIAIIDWDMAPDAAIAMPHLANRNGPFEIEEGPAADRLAKQLEALGYDVWRGPMDSGMAVIAIGDKGLQGAADPRREGVAIGR
jgi:gamma-glutamyltranspeptidase/glutathione hydrolase